MASQPVPQEMGLQAPPHGRLISILVFLLLARGRRLRAMIHFSLVMLYLKLIHYAMYSPWCSVSSQMQLSATSLLSIANFFTRLSFNRRTSRSILSRSALPKIAPTLMASTSATRPISTSSILSLAPATIASRSARAAPMWQSLMCYVVQATASVSVASGNIRMRKMSSGWQWATALLLAQQMDWGSRHGNLLRLLWWPQASSMRTLSWTMSTTPS